MAQIRFSMASCSCDGWSTLPCQDLNKSLESLDLCWPLDHVSTRSNEGALFVWKGKKWSRMLYGLDVHWLKELPNIIRNMSHIGFNTSTCCCKLQTWHPIHSVTCHMSLPWNKLRKRPVYTSSTTFLCLFCKTHCYKIHCDQRRSFFRVWYWDCLYSSYSCQEKLT